MQFSSETTAVLERKQGILTAFEESFSCWRLERPDTAASQRRPPRRDTAARLQHRRVPVTQLRRRRIGRTGSSP